jgi:arylformamidase
MPETEWIDISLPLNKVIHVLPPLPLLPGQEPGPENPPSSVYRFFDVEKGDKVTMSRIEMVSHDGTHIDAPLHFIPGGLTIDAMPIETTVGPCRVIEIKDEKDITVAELEPCGIRAGERILFKTRNSPRVYTVRQYTGEYVAITPEAARYLVARKIRLVGLDYLTIGHLQPPESINEVHRAFLSNGIFVLEALNLAGVAPGDYDLVCLPLRIEKGDAGPCRAVIRSRKKV